MSANEKLLGIVIPPEMTICSDVKCNRAEHKHIIDSYTDEVLKAINDTAYECLPVVGNSNS